MASIRVNKGVIRIEVNDNGDTITLRKDLNFVNNVKSFIAGLDGLQKEFDTKAAQLAPDDENGRLDLVFNLHKELHDGLDYLFGEGTCKKVFGDGEIDVIPTMEGVVDFIEQITPFVKQLTDSLVSDKKVRNVAKPVEVVAEPVEVVTPAKGVSIEVSRPSTTFSSLRQQLGMDSNG